MVNYKEVLSEEQIKRYMDAGATEQEIQDAVNEQQPDPANAGLQASYQQAQQMRLRDPRSSASNSFIAGAYNENLIQWQLELDSILERIEHMLRGDRPKWINGSIIWNPPLTTDDRIFNEFGVAEIMRILSNYVNRNTILSNYKEEVINEKMLDLGWEINDLIFLKYEDFGFDTLSKRKLYPMIVRELVDVTHSSYLRALHGGERESLREARQVTQTDSSSGAGINIQTGMPRQERGLLNPARYLFGKYK